MDNTHHFIDILFEVALVCNALIFVPQIVRLIRAKSAQGVSLTMFILFTVTQLTQVFYAYLHRDAFYGYGVGLVFIFCLTTMLLVFYYHYKQCQLTKLSKVALYAVVMLLVMTFMVDRWVNQATLIAVVHVLYLSSFAAVVFAAIPQLISLYRYKNASELSLITFAGFNVIQALSAWHAYLYQEWLFLLGMIVLFIVYGSITALLLYYRFIFRPLTA